MANITNILRNSIGDQFFGDVSPTVPNTYYLGISTTPLAVDGTGATEPTDPSYLRVAITNDKTSFESFTNGTASNLVQLIFPESTVDWGIVQYWFLSDSSTGGNTYLFGDLTASKTVEAQTILQLDPGDLNITIS